MANLSTVNQLFKELKTEFSKGSRDLKKCGNLLEQLKVKISLNFCIVLVGIFANLLFNRFTRYFGMS
jgi:hypothetical protein